MSANVKYKILYDVPSTGSKDWPIGESDSLESTRSYLVLNDFQSPALSNVRLVKVTTEVVEQIK